jgi:hypothetical protein
LERYKDKLARANQRKLSKASGESTISLAPPSSELSNRTESTPEGDVCEICEQPGHDIFSCHLLKDDIPSGGGSSRTEHTYTDSESSELWCEDCESHGYVFSWLCVVFYRSICVLTGMSRPTAHILWMSFRRIATTTKLCIHFFLPSHVRFHFSGSCLYAYVIHLCSFGVRN